jgi:hypothetical protein
MPDPAIPVWLDRTAMEPARDPSERDPTACPIHRQRDRFVSQPKKAARILLERRYFFDFVAVVLGRAGPVSGPDVYSR